MGAVADRSGMITCLDSEVTMFKRTFLEINYDTKPFNVFITMIQEVKLESEQSALAMFFKSGDHAFPECHNRVSYTIATVEALA